MEPNDLLAQRRAMQQEEKFSAYLWEAWSLNEKGTEDICLGRQIWRGEEYRLASPDSFVLPVLSSMWEWTPKKAPIRVRLMPELGGGNHQSHWFDIQPGERWIYSRFKTNNIPVGDGQQQFLMDLPVIGKIIDSGREITRLVFPNGEFLTISVDGKNAAIAFGDIQTASKQNGRLVTIFSNDGFASVTGSPDNCTALRLVAQQIK